MAKILEFPKDFLWGAATSAYQVEGGIENSDWSQAFPAGRSCDHYNLYEKDFDIIQKLNLNSYRFSIEWSKIEPRPGFFDKKEIEHYKNFLNSLKKRNIKIMATLHHFSSPLWFSKIGGFASNKSVFYFLRFSQKIFREYKNIVDFWITINEPEIYATKGYLQGTWPPQKTNPILFFKVIRNQILAHKKIYEYFHKLKPDVKIGIAKNNQFFEPFNQKSRLDRFSVFLVRRFWNDFFLNKVKNKLDFIGLNYYFHSMIKFPFFIRNENKIISDIGWEIYPEGIYHLLKELKKFNLPIYITENGLADAKDEKRKDFIKEHLFWILKAIEEGVDGRGYFHWSLMDNFEWDKGFSPRFGLAEIDYKNFERKSRPSAHYFSKIAKENYLETNTQK